MKHLFCDCKTDAEKANFFLSGRAVETGIVAPAISNDVAMAYHRCAEFQKEIDTLRAKIEAMEQQEPVAFGLYSGWALKATYLKEHEACEQRDRRQLTADLGGSLEAYRVAPLYALPGAQPAPSVPDGWKLVPIDPTQNMLDCMDLGSNMLYRYRALLAAAPEVKP